MIEEIPVPCLKQVLALGRSLQRTGPPAPPRPGPPPGSITLTQAQRIELDLLCDINKAQDAHQHDERRGMGLTYRRSHA